MVFLYIRLYDGFDPKIDVHVEHIYSDILYMMNGFVLGFPQIAHFVPDILITSVLENICHNIFKKRILGLLLHR